MNESIFSFFYSFAHRNSTLDFLINFTAQWYPYIILVALFVYLFEHRDNPQKGVRDLFVVGVAAGSAWFIAHVLKDIFQTLRPFVADTSMHALFIEPGYAFPSGHATFFMALASSLWFYHKRLSIFFGISAVLIGLARISSGVHWPIDILGGLILGCVVGTGSYYLLRYFTNRCRA